MSQVVAANVRAQAAMRGWTQREMCRRLGMTPVMMSDRYRERTPWTVDETQKLADLFGIEVGELLARPKGFEPLTFWLGADHTVTTWWSTRERWVGDRVGWDVGTYFCDLCGHRGPVTGSRQELDHVRLAHGVTSLGVYDGVLAG